MKSIIATFLLMTLSVSAHASQLNELNPFGTTSVLTYMMSSYNGPVKEARQVLQDYSQFEATGRLTENLNKKITDVRIIEPKLSIDDALDAIVAAANQIIAESEK